MRRMLRIVPSVMLLILLGALAPARAADWQNLLADGLKGWEVLGDGIWTLRSDGVLIAHRKPNTAPLEALGDKLTFKQYRDWEIVQSWLYTRKQYGDFDLRLDYWVRTPGNSGISIRDPSHARYALTIPPDYSKTPSKVGYEIQINSQWPDPHPTGSIYGLADARTGLQNDGEWNTMNIESRKDNIRVLVNGVVAAEHAADPARPTAGPIGLQLHDQASVVMFRNLWVREP
jgi:3-keto-disaccharide hydrolase